MGSRVVFDLRHMLTLLLIGIRDCQFTKIADLQGHLAQLLPVR